MTPQNLWPLGAELGEGPVWIPEQNRLYFVNLVGNTLHALPVDRLLGVMRAAGRLAS